MRGLLAIEPLYHQIVYGRKTQTRRSGGLEVINDWPDEWGVASAGMRPYPHNQITSILFIRKGVKRGDVTDADSIIFKPRYHVGEVMYLKEPYIGQDGHYSYKFDLNPNSQLRKGNGSTVKWKNKLFMPAAAARAFIKITGIRCERLLDISDEDCIAEGIEMGYAGDDPFGYINYLMTPVYGYDYIDNTPKESFISLYKLANKLAKVGSVPTHGSLPTPPGVDNIWVWAYTFEYLKDFKYEQ